MLLPYLKLLFRAWKYRLVADRNEIRFLLKKIKKGDVVLDIGAHKGGYTYWMKKAAGTKGRVIAFEPQRNGAAVLKQLFHPPQVTIEQMAVSDQPGKLILFVQPQAYDVSFEASLTNRYPDAMQEEVEVTTLDQYCKEKSLLPAFIKIDVEGNELKVLQGAQFLIQEIRPSFLIEIETRHVGEMEVQSIFFLLRNAGYSGRFYYDHKKYEIDAFISEKHQDVANLNTPRYANNFLFEPR